MFFWQKKPEPANNPDRKILNAIQDDRGLLTLSIGSQQASSLMLEVRPAALLLDSLTPIQVQHELKPGNVVLLQGKHNGIRWNFRTSVIGLEQDYHGGDSLLLLQLPKKIEYSQQRKEYRATIKSYVAAQVSFFRPADGKNRGRPLDISNSGMRIAVPQIMMDLGVGEVLTRGELQLPGLPAIPFEAEVKNYHYDRRKNQSILGLCFSQIKSSDQKLLTRFSLEMQKEQHRTES